MNTTQSGALVYSKTQGWGAAVLHRLRTNGDFEPNRRRQADDGVRHAERLMTLEMIEPRGERSRAITLGADKGYDVLNLIAEVCEQNLGNI